jgi:GPH family glycoside/pentoside/hexuronide:cation symporter
VLGLSVPLFFVQVYFLNYATDVLLLAPAAVGGLFALGRLWDAVTDPAVGFLSDRTNTRLGRRRPWMMAGLPLLMCFFAMLWMPPESLQGGLLLGWVGVALFGFYTAYTIYSIPHASLGAELSKDHHDRTRIFAVRHVSLTVGIIGAFGALQFVQNAEAPREAARTVVFLFVPVSALLLSIPPLTARERVEYRGRGGGNPLRAARDVYQNPHARLLLTVLFVEALGGATIGVLAPFLAKYVLEAPEAVALLPAFFVAASVGSVPMWVRLSRRFGKHRVWRLAMVGDGLAFGATMIVGPGDVALTAFLLLIAGIFAGAGGAVSQSVLADIMDFDEYETGERKEGAYSAAAGFCFKAAAGCTVAMTGFAISAAGFVPNEAQTPLAIWTLKGLFGGAPMLANLIGATMFRKFKLDAVEHARIRAVLDARHLANDADAG